ncbi:BAM_G0000890.mRNA.1.CDS.1 [Saccharomyces cerevisiae]|nr:BAM_G0000890.mRNA.1.CDS.1 [Saccharomyces cerevisiae]CAI7035561.1 BAM_G0000890.mRNA.1.CDS.1 [Saccharomyces cerevisiae]
MDTGTESERPLLWLVPGGIGFIHDNCTPEDQADQDRRVKNYEMGLLTTVADFSNYDRSWTGEHEGKVWICRLPCNGRWKRNAKFVGVTPRGIQFVPRTTLYSFRMS